MSCYNVYKVCCEPAPVYQCPPVPITCPPGSYYPPSLPSVTKFGANLQGLVAADEAATMLSSFNSIYVRDAFSDLKNYTGGINSGLETHFNAGMYVLFNISWEGDPTGPKNFPTDLTLYQSQLDLFMASNAKFMKIAVIENEPANGAYYNYQGSSGAVAPYTTVDDYLAILQIAVQVCHKYGVAVADGATHITYYDQLMNPPIVDAAAQRGDDLLNGYALLNLDYVNFHFQLPDPRLSNGAIMIPGIIKKYADYLTKRTRKKAISNEWHYEQSTLTDAEIDALCIESVRQLREAGVEFALAFSGDWQVVTPPAALNYVDLHQNLVPALSPTTNGWSITNAWNGTSGVDSTAGIKKYKDDGSPDVFSFFNDTSGTASVNRDLGTNDLTNLWKITGLVTFEETVLLDGTSTACSVDVLDAAGKLLARLRFTIDFTTDIVTIYGNTAIIAIATGLQDVLWQLQPLTIGVSHGTAAFTYANFPTISDSLSDPEADWKKPKTLRQQFTGGTPAYGQRIGFMDMRFYPDETLPSPPAPTLRSSGAFPFTLATQQRTSAGVFRQDGTLVRTLWTNITYSAGTHIEVWDGNDDHRNKITSPDTNYVVKVLSNNVTYHWDGVIGNTSASQVDPGVHRALYTCMDSMAITGGAAYLCQGYSEGRSTIAKFLLTDPQIHVDFKLHPDHAAGRVTTPESHYVTTDGTYVYWAGFDAYSPSQEQKKRALVFATRVSDDTLVEFPSGTYFQLHYETAGMHWSAIDLIENAYDEDHPLVNDPYISGLAVNSTYLFVSHRWINKLHVLNKTTGALVQNITITNPQYICTEGESLWIVSGTNTVRKYVINPNGTLGTQVLTITAVSLPGPIQVFGTTIAIEDLSTQMVRFFNTVSGLEGTALGTPGGYANSPVVGNTKFFLNFSQYSFIAFAPDGSFWLGDSGNYRVLHFSATHTYIETIMSLGASYSTCVDPNDITRVFSDYLEFAIDYSQPLSGSTGWRLIRNWGYGQQGVTAQEKFENIVTLSNGRTYGFNNKWTDFIELTATGIRVTGLFPGGLISPQGWLQIDTGEGNMGDVVTIIKYPLTGFDSNNNPKWGNTGEILATTPVRVDLKHPDASPYTIVLSSTNKVIFYERNTLLQGHQGWYFTGYHLGAIRKGESTWLWETARATGVDQFGWSYYAGEFPEADFYDVGNSVNQYSGSRVNVIDNHVITGYHGEFWKQSQTNYYNHYLDDGLAVGQFGTDGRFSHNDAIAEDAGNALTPQVVKDANGDLLLYHGDESKHGGIHRWTISNLNTIAEQSATIPYPSGQVSNISGGALPMVDGSYNLTHLGAAYSTAIRSTP